jgi:hypothetical protein
VKLVSWLAFFGGRRFVPDDGPGTTAFPIGAGLGDL